jgi:hypothetical protein
VAVIPASNVGVGNNYRLKASLNGVPSGQVADYRLVGPPGPVLLDVGIQAITQLIVQILDLLPYIDGRVGHAARRHRDNADGKHKPLHTMLRCSL